MACFTKGAWVFNSFLSNSNELFQTYKIIFYIVKFVCSIKESWKY